MVYEVVCTKHYFDVGLLIEKNSEQKPKQVLARASTYGSGLGYGGVELCTWINTGVFLSIEEWKHISYNKSTDQILNELGIEKKIYFEPTEEPVIEEIIDYSFVPETLDWCKEHYVPPIKEHINCPDFGHVDWMNGGCHWCKEMYPYQCEMCRDESWVRGLLSPAARIQAKTRKEAAEFIENYKQKYGK